MDLLNCAWAFKIGWLATQPSSFSLCFVYKKKDSEFLLRVSVFLCTLLPHRVDLTVEKTISVNSDKWFYYICICLSCFVHSIDCDYYCKTRHVISPWCYFSSLHWSTLGLKSPAGTRTLPMFTMSWSTPRPQTPSSTWSTTTLLASLSSSVRETWRLKSCRRGLRFLLSCFIFFICLWASWFYKASHATQCSYYTFYIVPL